MRSRKVLFHEFYPVIYPFRLWIAITDNGDIVKEKFVNCVDDEELNIEGFASGEAVVYCVVERGGDRKNGFLVVFMDRKYMNMKTVSHEATHVVRRAWAYLKENNIIGIEADAYLVGWVADCIERVKLGKE
jgi:hypothetical protein